MTTNNNEFETQNAEVNNIETDTAQDYIATINAMKKNSVSRTEYDKLRQENRNLLQTLAEGGSIQIQETKTPVDVNALRNELFSKDCGLNNLEYIEKTLELREALIENGEPDPFLPFGSRISPTTEETIQAQNVADVFRQCVEYANGDSQIFTQELQRRTVDSNPMANRGRRR